ncbi:MAG: site-specific integrase [Clostridia bacterium]|nr:site-specific integrase [Clostridia bacterium]
MNYQQWSKEWMANYVKPSVKERTYLRYANVLRCQILPSLGEIELDDISPLLVQRFITKITERGNCLTGEKLSANSVNVAISVLKNSLKSAYDVGIIDHYLDNRLKRPKREERKVECFSIRDQHLLEEGALKGKRKYIGVIVCLYTGLRLGEVLALKWSDVNLKRRQISINRTCYDVFVCGKNERVEHSAKTASSNRVIPIPPFLRELLKEYRKNGTSEYVVEDKGKIVGLRSYQHSFELLQHKCGVEYKNFHALRHTFATRAIECGMDVKTLSEILGHKNSTVTLNRYVHSLSTYKRSMMNKVGKLFAGSRSGFCEFK